MTLGMPMTATQQLLAHQAGLPLVRSGDVLVVPVNWVLASELALKGMLVTHRQLGEPPLANPERFILAVDHTVGSFTPHNAKALALASVSNQFRNRYNLKHFYAANESILHTAPYQDLFRPGDVIVGADSHSIFHGGLGAFSIGLGAADVMMAAVLGAFILKVPDAIRINIEGHLPTMLTGKDLILTILSKLGRNTVAFERTVEYGGSGLKHLSASDRGAVCNMGAEFGAMTSFFIPDETVAKFMATRNGEFREGGLYFDADENAPYVARQTIRLSENLPPQVAVYPSPDNVRDVTHPDIAGKEFQTAFVGTCTTGPEDYVLAALTADAALKAGHAPVAAGAMGRLISPSSTGIAKMLQKYGLIEPFQDLGFKVGLAGCSLCLAVDGYEAPEGSWVLGSHNRPFPNRTGKGSYSMVASAATVVASAVNMRVTDPRTLLPYFDDDRYRRILADLRGEELVTPEIRAVRGGGAETHDSPTGADGFSFNDIRSPAVIRGRVLKFGDNVDTDAIIPGRFCHLEDPAELGEHSFENEMGAGSFRRKIREEGTGIVAAGIGWGSGSSREEAAYALQGAGVELVIAKNIAFIHQRNLVNQAIPFRLMHPEDRDALYDLLQEGASVEVDLGRNVVTVEGQQRPFRLLPIHAVEQAVQSLGGLANAYRTYGSSTLQAILALSRSLSENS